MTITRTAWNTISSTTSSFSYTTTSATLASGSYLIITFSCASQFNNGTVTVSDSASGTWNQIFRYGTATTTPNMRSYIRTTPGTGGSFTVTVGSTSSSTGGFGLFADAFAGGTNTLSSVASATGTTATPSVSTPSASSGDMFYAVGAVTASAANQTLTAGSGWTSIGTWTSSASRQIIPMFRAATGSGSVTATFSSTGTLSSTVIQTFVLYDEKSYIGWGLPL